MRRIPIIWSLILIISTICHSAALANAKAENLESPSRWLLTIGISRYRDPELNLEFAANDAKIFHETLMRMGKFRSNPVYPLIDSEATRENIKSAITEWLQNNAHENDLIVIYFSGHGGHTPDRNGDEEDGQDEYIIPYDFIEHSKSNKILDDEFAQWVKNLPSQRIVIVFDCCFAGGGAKIKSPWVDEIKSEVRTDDFVKDITRELPKEKEVAFLASSSENQYSIEHPSLQQSVFTYFLCTSFTIEADRDGDEAISLEESYEYLRPLVVEFVRSNSSPEVRQTPVFINGIREEVNLVFFDSFNLPVASQKEEEEERKFLVLLEGEIEKLNLQDAQITELTLELEVKINKLEQRDAQISELIRKQAELEKVIPKVETQDSLLMIGFFIAVAWFVFF